MTIHHKGNFFYKLLSSSFYKTSIVAEGFLIRRFLKKPILLPWTEIQCLDLSGLNKRDYSWATDRNLKDYLREGYDRRFFLIMSSNHTLLRNCYAGMKTWHAAENVLGLTQITEASAEEIFPVLTRIAQENKIIFDIIVLDG